MGVQAPVGLPSEPPVDPDGPPVEPTIEFHDRIIGGDIRFVNRYRDG
jgi:hypothetical protein